MISRNRKKTWLYLFTAAGAVVLLAVSAFAVVSIIALKKTAYSQTEENLRQFSYSVRNYLSINPEQLDKDALQKFCISFGNGSEFRLTVVAPDGTVIADSNAKAESLDNHKGRPEILAALEGREKGVVRYSDTLKKTLVYYAIPLNTLALRIAAPADYVDSAVRGTLLALILSAFAILIAALGVSLIVSSRIISPLQKLQNAANYYSAGNLDVTIDSTRFPQEFIDLAKTFSLMAEKLREKIRSLNEQNREFEAILTGMNDALIVLDSNNLILRVNRAAEEVFHFSASDIKGLPLIQAVRNTDIVDFAQNPKTRAKEITVELRIGAQDGLQFLLVRSSQIEESSGQLLVFSDITRLKSLERIRKDFVANVSHELKTPVTSLKGFIETLKDGALDDRGTAVRFLQIMDGQATRLIDIIDDLLTLSRLEQNENTSSGGISKEMTLIRVLLDDVKTICEEEARKKNTTILYSCSENLACTINPGLIEQALTNLVLNAVKYSPPEARVTVNGWLENDEANGEDSLVFTVTDNGIGIPQRDQARIFERFYRIDKGRSRNQGGTGLGLSIVRHIALVHGGSVSVESTEGEGSVFRVDIPV